MLNIFRKKRYDVDNTLFVIAVVFNPIGFNSRYKLYKEFAPYMKFSGAKLLTVEVALEGEPFIVTKRSNPWNLQLRTKHELWHKERAINLGFEKLLKLVPNAKYVAWIDADVRFSNPHWVKDSIKKLHHNDVIQLFSEAQSLNPRYESQWKTPGIIYNYYHKVGYHQEPPLSLRYTAGGHPGLAWAATVEALKKLGGLIDFCVHGSGDTHVANALMGDIHHGLLPGCPKGLLEALEKWAENCHNHVKFNIGYVNGICMHYWHGKPQRRGYEKRWSIISFHQFDPKTDLELDDNGLYRFTGNKPHLRYDLRRSLSERNEDSIDA